MKDYIIYLGTIFLPDKNAAAQRAMSICKSYRDLGRKPIIIGVSNEINHSEDILNTYSNHQGFDTYSMLYPKTSFEWTKRLYSIKQIIQVINKYGAENIHSIVVMDYMSIALYRLMKYCSKNDIRIVIDTVDWFNKSEYKFPKNKVKDLDTIIRMKYLHNKTNYMIAISQYLYDYYKNQVNNLVMVPGTVDINDEKWSSIKKYSGNEILTLGYAGNPGEKFERERLDWLIKIVTELNSHEKKCKLIMAGVHKHTTIKNKPELYNLIKNDENIIFLGNIPHKDCLDMIATSDFSVIIRENTLVNKAGFPTKLSESFACGTPVISTATSNISDYLKDGINGFLVKDFTYDALKRTIEAILKMDKNRICIMHNLTKKTNELNYKKYNSNIKLLLE